MIRVYQFNPQFSLQVIFIHSLIPVEAARKRCKRDTMGNFIDTVKGFGNSVVETMQNAGSSIKSYMNKAGRWFRNTFNV